jgi:diadenosine tetraphosphatase ApaH/serine/threonine PP2A family protein phosphatase
MDPDRGSQLMIALISDIHSNVEALQAVFADMQAFPVEQTFCLGDVIGYGPEPRETLELVKSSAFILLGNHEEGLLKTAEGFNDRARRALDWTCSELNSAAYSREANHALWNLIDGFLEQKQVGDRLYVHASPRQPVREYVMPADALDRSKMRDIFDHFGSARACFGGHTHVPGIFSEAGGFRHQSDWGERVALPAGRSLVNVGSVGQPRDGDPRASYVLMDGDELLFRRVPYDVETTMRKIAKNPALDDFLARRLKAGQ